MFSQTINRPDRSATFGRRLSWAGTSLAVLLLGAHFFRAGDYGLAASALGLIYFNCAGAAWKKYALAFFLFWGGLEWGQTVYRLILIRTHFGLPWFRGAMILSAVAAFTVMAGLWAFKRGRSQSPAAAERPLFKALVFMLTFLLLLFVNNQAGMKLLLLERFWPGWGGLQVFLLSCYSAFMAGWLMKPKRTPKVRKMIWLGFSAVFFGQLLLGLLGFERLLMSGQLHVPAPAFIIFSPLYRGEMSFFMPILVLAATILAGTSWCSFLCYFGPFDALASGSNKKAAPWPDRLRPWLRYGRLAVLLVGALTAVGLGVWGASFNVVMIFTAGFILISFGLMLGLSRKYSAALHCSAFCPLGLLISLLGRLSPWRIRVKTDLCTDCRKCEDVCDYKAITAADRRRGRTRLRCSMCRDCLERCSARAIYVWSPLFSERLGPFVLTAIISILHVLFLAAARV